MSEALRKAAEQALYVIDAWERDCDYSLYWRDRDDAMTALRAALAEPEQAEPVKFLANATRFKMAFFQNEDGEGNQTAGTHVTCFGAFEDELDGRWVALVPAEDDCHLKYTAPPAQTPVPPRLTDEQIDTIESAALVAGGDYTDAFRAIESAVRKQWATHFGVTE